MNDRVARQFGGTEPSEESPFALAVRQRMDQLQQRARALEDGDFSLLEIFVTKRGLVRRAQQAQVEELDELYRGRIEILRDARIAAVERHRSELAAFCLEHRERLDSELAQRLLEIEGQRLDGVVRVNAEFLTTMGSKLEQITLVPERFQPLQERLILKLIDRHQRKVVELLDAGTKEVRELRRQFAPGKGGS
jgi:hypothetical protein